MAIVPYQLNEKDKLIIDHITTRVRRSLNIWYGEGAHFDGSDPEIRSYRFCFIFRYPIRTSTNEKKAVLVKIRRHPKMDSLWQALAADIHGISPGEYDSLESMFNWLAGVDDDFGVIRPLEYFERYHAIVMEEFPSRTLKQLLMRARSSSDGTGTRELEDAAKKAGRLLRYFHHNIHFATATSYSTQDILNDVETYANQIETYARGRVQARSIVIAFSQKLENIQINSMVFSKTHADLTGDNILYSDDEKVCLIDIKARLAPVYSDLGLLIINPETYKQQIFTGGLYLPASLLKKYREAILAGYFEGQPRDEFLVKLFSALKVLEKWNMYEELMSRYKGTKRLLSIPGRPLVTIYFQQLLRKHLVSMHSSKSPQVFRVPKPEDRTA
jgi:thiamine kinase-like enzyme